MSTMQHLSTIIREFWQERVLGRKPEEASQTPPKRHAALDISQFPPQALGAGAYLRPLVEEDLPELVALEELCYDGFLAWTLKAFRTDSRRLVQRWCRCVSQIGSRRVTLEVRATNQAAQSLYQGLGFEIERLVPNYYHTMQEDALFMVYDCQQ